MSKIRAADYHDSLSERNKYLGFQGTIISLTTIYQPSSEFEFQIPYTVGEIKLEDGSIVNAQVIDGNVGDSVIGCLRKLRVDGKSGLIWYGVKFTLA